MMDLTIIAGAEHQVRCAEAVASGVRAIGGKAVIKGGDSSPTKQVCCWGWRRGRVLRERGHEVLVMERGYIGDRFKWYSLGWNGLNGRATFPAKSEEERFDSNFAHLMRPWKAGGEYVLLVGQVPGDMSLQGRDLMPWYAQAAAKAEKAYGLPVRFRMHPQAIARGYRQNPPGCKPIGGTLSEALDGAAVVLTYNSNTAVESALYGVPTVAIDQGSMAWPVSGHQIGSRETPDRKDWAARLAWRQWTLDEIATGAPFELA